MKSLFIISIYTILQTIKKKSFLISNIIIATFTLLIFVILGQYLEDASNAMNQIEEIEGIPVVLIDNTKTFGKNIYDFNTDPYIFVLISEDMIEEAKKEAAANEDIENPSESEEEISYEEAVKKIEEAIISGEINYAIYVEKNTENNTEPFSLKFLCGEEIKVDETEALLLTNMLKAIYKESLLISSGVNLPEFNFSVSYSVEELINNKNFLEGSYIIAIAVSMLLFLAIYLYGHSIASSISSEKMSRIIETLVTSTKPRLIVIGKTIGMGVLGLVQLTFLIVIAIFAYKTLIPSELDVVAEFLSSVNINQHSVLILIVFFVLGYLLYAFAFAVVGAIISKSEDVQIANMPLSLISLFSFYLSLFTLDIPDTSLSKFASFFPFSSAFSIPAKMFAGNINVEEVYLSIGILIISVIFVAFCAIRIYSNVILNYGNKLKFKDIFNMFMNIK